MLNNLLFILLQVHDTIVKYVVQHHEPVKAVLESQSESFNIYNVLGILIGSGSVLYLLVSSYIKQKEKKVDNDIETKKEHIKHENILDMEKFNMEKTRDTKIQEENERFQKEIINSIFEKYVKQNDWITLIYEKKFEDIINLLSELTREVKDVRLLNDKMNMQIKNIDDKVIKNTNIIIAKVDALLKVFADISFTCVKDSMKNLPIENIKILQRQTEDIKITQD